jgi:unsaturated chondroitin disaccharide hydrolase
LLDPLRTDYERAALGTMVRLADSYATVDGAPGAGLLKHAVYHMPNRVGVNEACIWGDYFYLEALVRLTRIWQPYW